MSLVLAIVFWSVLAALALLVLACALPLRIRFTLRKQDTWKYSAALHSFAGYGPRVVLTDRKRKSKSRHRKPAKSRRKSRFDWRGDPLHLLGCFKELLTGLLQRVHIDSATINMAFGLGDPADTGQAFGLLAPVVYGPCRQQRMQITVEPVFDRAVLRGRAELTLSLVPVRLLAPLVRFGWSVLVPRK